MDSPDATRYRVVCNDDDQHSIWAADAPLPAGWRDLDVSGSREECLAHIGTVWHDITPRSIRAKVSSDN
jgi:MbtH protein